MSTAESIPGASDLTLSAEAIFGEGRTSFPLANGTLCEIRPATMGQIGKILQFFTAVIESVNPEHLTALIEGISQKQAQAIAEGRSPFELDFRDKSPVELVQSSFGELGIMASLFASVVDKLPMLAPAFSNLSSRDFENLSIEEGMIVAGSIFMVNYDFFTRSLPPILTAFMKSWASKQQASVKQSPVVSASKKGNSVIKRTKSVGRVG